MATPIIDEKKIFKKTPLPPDLARQAIALTENARTVLQKRYLRKGEDGKPVETEEEMFWRVAYHVALAEKTLGGSEAEVEAIARRYYALLTELKFFPNSPTFTGAGTPLGQLAACFVLGIDDDMGRTGQGIFETLRNAALIQQTGGGNGFAFSRLRPKGATVKSSGGAATGPVGFLRVYDQAFGEVAQGGCLTPDTLVFTDRGLLRLDEIVTHSEEGWHEHELSVSTDEGMRPSYQGYSHGVGPVLRVTTHDGLQLTGTPNHKLKVMTPQGPAWKRFDELQAGDALMVMLGQHQGYLQTLEQPSQAHFNQVMPTFPQVLDEDLAFLVGYLMGDGFIAAGDDDYRVGVSVAHSSYLMQAMPTLLHDLFGEQLSIHTQQKTDDASVTFVIHNRALKEFLLLNGLDKASSTQVRVPRLIRQSPPQIVGAFLRGLFEADGAVTHGYPELVSTSQTLITEVAALLIGLGCPVRIVQVTPNSQRYGKSPLWRLKIQSFRGLQAWRDLIGCDEGSRFANCLHFTPDLNRESNYPLPNAEYWVKSVLEAISLPQSDKRGRGMGRNLRASDPQLRRALLRYTRQERQLTLSGYTQLAQEHPQFADHARAVEDFWFVTVARVEAAGQALTLDIEVEENHTYLANGVVSHNSRRGANMAVLRVDHPDIREFIQCKATEGAIENFNISVGITDAFMQAVENDGDFELVNPHDGKVWEVVKARELFDMIVQYAYRNGEPGVLFLDTANRENPVPHLYELESTNPCVTGDMLLATEYGLIRFDELVEWGEPMFVAADNRAPHDHDAKHIESTLGVALRPASPVWMTRQNTPVMRLTTKGGYNIKATPDHKILTPQGYIELQHLKPGDMILIQSGEGAWSKNYTLPNIEHMRQTMAVMAYGGDHASGHVVQRGDFQALYENIPQEWSHSLGLLMGWIVGDGWLTTKSNSPLGMVFGNDASLEIIREAMSEFFGEGHLHIRGNVRQLTYGRVPFEFFRSLGLQTARAHEKYVPASIWRAPREAVIGFLQGLFSADGTVQLKGLNHDCSIRLASSSPKLLEDVQILLANFGIAAKIHLRRKAGEKLMPDSKRQPKLYAYKAQYELILGKANRDRFAEIIGFIDTEKQAKVMRYIETKLRPTNPEPFLDPVSTIEDAGTADVYDLTQYQTHSLLVNGISITNCGEQFLGPYENCCLGSVNLAQHITPDGRVDWALLQESVETSTRFLDHVVTANAYVPAVPQLREAAERVRRIGLGIMGLADMMYAVGVRYGSLEGQEFASQIMEFVRYHTMKTSIELAKQHGPFLAIEGSRFDPANLGWTIPQGLVAHVSDWERPALDWANIEEEMLQHGIRNGCVLTVAPTGCVIPGTMVISEQGILPIETLGNPKGSQWQDLHLAVASEGGQQYATQFYINGYAHTIKATTKRGYTLQATDQHRIRVWSEGTWVWCRMDELKPGMCVPLQQTGLIGKSQPVYLDARLATDFHASPIQLPTQMTPELAYLVGYFMGDGSLKTRSLRFSISDQASEARLVELFQQVFGVTPLISRDERSKNLRSLEIHSRNLVEYWQANHFAKNIPYVGHHGKGYEPHIPLEILKTNDAEVYGAFLAGLFDADGTIHNGYHLVWTTTTQQFHDQVKTILLALGILTTSDYQTTGLGQSRAYRLRTAHSEAASKLTEALPYLVRAIPGKSQIRRKTLGDGVPLSVAEYNTLVNMAKGTTHYHIAFNWRQQMSASRSSLVSFVAAHRETVLAAGLDDLVQVVDENIHYDEITMIEDGGFHDTYDISVPGPHAYIANGFISHNTIATVSGCEGYGCEPVFALAYLRYMVNNAGNSNDRHTLQYTSPLFEKALQSSGLAADQIERIIAEVNETGTCQHIQEVPDNIRRVFVVAGDISVEEHIRMQAAMQAWVDNALSKTINAPSTATPDDVAQAYLLGWKLGCKGLTVYVTGSREKVVLETKATLEKKAQADQAATPSAIVPAAPAQPTLFNEEKKPRPRHLVGKTYRTETPAGTAYVTVNENGYGEGQPFEVFVMTAKPGSEVMAVSEALGRLMSYVLRLSSPVSPRKRLKEMVRQLGGIGGERSIGFGPSRVRSLPDGVAQVLAEYLEESTDTNPQPADHRSVTRMQQQALPIASHDDSPSKPTLGDICPSCGAATLVNEEGCQKCYSCGHSEC
jgi:ribonucleotide reductase alpha subunit